MPPLFMKNNKYSQQVRQQLRKERRAQRQALSSEFQHASAHALQTQLAKRIKDCEIKHIAVYLANDGELDLSPFIHWCWQHNIVTYLPVIHPFSKGHLLFLHYHAHSEMITNQYGIFEPKLNVCEVLPCAALDMILTPLVAFDSGGERLGMGGGYYDRTLNYWYQHRTFINKPYPIGIAHDCQQVDEIPSESWDIPLPEIITPTKHFKFF